MKLKRCTAFLNPPDPVLKALVELVERQGWSNSLQDLATSTGAIKDDQPRLGRNTDLLLKAILDKLANSNEWKLMEMCHRQELKYVVNTSLSCCHRWNHQTDRRNPATDTMEWSVPIDCPSASANREMTQADLQEQIKRFNSSTQMVECKVCHKIVQLTVSLTVPVFCDPDFLTLVCDSGSPVSIKQQNVTLQFSNNTYSVKAVTHWDKGRRMAAVSREKMDGSWWWHGVVRSQALDYKYSERELQSSRHLKDVVVLFAVRIELEEDQSQGGSDVSLGEEQATPDDIGFAKHLREDVSQEAGHRSLGEDQFLKGDLEVAPDTLICEEMLRTSERDMTCHNAGAGGIDAGACEGGGDIQFHQDMETAQARSREETPGCLPAEKAIQLGIEAAAKLGILCKGPNLKKVHNSFVPMDGNCIQSSCCHANDPSLDGEPLKHAAWELRVRGVGALVESLKNFSDLQWSLLQGIITGSDDEEPLSRDTIKLELEKYMNRGEFSGNLGDILPQLAADTLNQPLLVIEIEKCQVRGANWVVPGCGGIFGGGDREAGFPIVLIKQLQHYEPLLIAPEAKEMAKLKFQHWKSSKRVRVSAELPVTCKEGEGVGGKRRDRTPSPDSSKRSSKQQGRNHVEMPASTAATNQEYSRGSTPHNAGEGNYNGITDIFCCCISCLGWLSCLAI